jgi:NAD(P)-dependent dehydrogenase (short-subunit alcohol dehydrogenase family)
MAATKWTVQQIPSQMGKTALVTGANSGIGYQAALELARHGAHVLLACRNAAKGQAALERLKREAPGAAAELVEVDMASLASIRSFATTFAGRARAQRASPSQVLAALPMRDCFIVACEQLTGI